MFPGGAHDLGHTVHIPAPGRVQYYRAEALPFVPAEIKCQIRFPKAYAQSQKNLRYLDRVREETQAFMDSNIAYNYFSAEQNVSLAATLGEAETLYSAGGSIKELAESGDLTALHERC